MRSENDLPLSAILDLLLELEGVTEPRQFCVTAMEAALTLVPADQFASCFTDDATGPRCIATNADEAPLIDFNLHYRKSIPFYAAAGPIPNQTDYRPWENTEYVSDFIRRHHIGRSALSACRGFAFGLHRGRGGRPFTDREMRTLFLFGRHVAVLFDRLERLSTNALPPYTQEELGNTLPFTRREVEVLRLAAMRLSNRQIASRLEISSRTVEKHFANMYDKTGERSRWGLLRKFSESVT
ncbi:helix-turn-helix transcriptional regulator [Salinispira pacifica]